MTIHKIHLSHIVLDEYVVFKLYPWHDLYFPFILGMAMYDNPEYEI